LSRIPVDPKATSSFGDEVVRYHVEVLKALGHKLPLPAAEELVQLCKTPSGSAAKGVARDAVAVRSMDAALLTIPGAVGPVAGPATPANVGEPAEAGTIADGLIQAAASIGSSSSARSIAWSNALTSEAEPFFGISGRSSGRQTRRDRRFSRSERSTAWMMASGLVIIMKGFRRIWGWRMRLLRSVCIARETRVMRCERL
jgi:hypothetical protein